MALMSVIITVILLLCGYAALLQSVNTVTRRSYYSENNMLIIDVVVGIMYLLVCGVIGLLYIYSGCDMFIIYATLILVVFAVLIFFIRFCWLNREGIKKINVILFLIYFGFILYLTVFMRIGGGDSSIVTTPFDDLTEAIKTGNIKLVEHMGLNVVMFVPFGYLIPAMNPDKLRKCSFVFWGGLMCSTVIEGVQMVCSLGQSDIDDIIANTIGSVIGYVVIRGIWQIQKNWRI